MTSFFNIVFLLSLSLAVGAIIFFSFFTTPTVFRELPIQIARDFVGKLFPQYYMLGYVTQFAALLSLSLRGLIEKPFPWVRVALLAVMLGCTLYAGLKIRPQAHLIKTVLQAMEPGAEQEAQQARFDRLHRISVILNGVSLLVGVAALGITAAKLRP
jgi:uncharacterized protein DUF4149